MATRPLFLTIFAIFLSYPLLAQLEGLVVETYYVSDSNDVLDAYGAILTEGSVTYRVYLNLEDDYALRSLVGDTAHPLQISSTELFFNHPLGGDFNQHFNTGFYPLGSLPLDSWITMGYAGANFWGILKEDDPDGSMVGGANNLEGKISAEEPAAGIPVTTADGMVPADDPSGLYSFYTFVNDSTFGAKTKGDHFLLYSEIEPYNGRLISLEKNYITGPTPENLVLIGQFTTLGELKFDLNCEIVSLTDSVPLSGGYQPVIYTLFNKDTLLPENTNSHKYLYSKFLSYPTVCGCTDPWFVEFNPAAVCDDGSCRDSIVLGCMDAGACNFNPGANFNVQELCCYSAEHCDGRDIKLVCPDWKSYYNSTGNLLFSVHPNPVSDVVTLDMAGRDIEKAMLKIVDLFGTIIYEQIVFNPLSRPEINLSHLPEGMYLFRIETQNAVGSLFFIKE